jgi:dephospho-CoA kinase
MAEKVELTMIIAVTGNLGTGKSTVCRLLAATLSAEMLDTDQLCRRQLQEGQEGYAAFLRKFDRVFIQENGAIDRQLLRSAVFSDAQVKKALEDILHPIVKRQVAKRIAACKTAGVDLVVEVPLLYEVGWQEEFEICVVVSIPSHLCVQRVLERDSADASDIGRVLASQMELSHKVALADVIIDNSGTFVSTVQQVNRLVRILKTRAQSRWNCHLSC